MADEITNYYDNLEIGALTYILFLLNAEIDNADKWRDITFDAEQVRASASYDRLLNLADEKIANYRYD